MGRAKIIFIGFEESDMYFTDLSRSHNTEFIQRKDISIELLDPERHIVIIQTYGMDYESEKLALEIKMQTSKWIILLATHAEYLRRLRNIHSGHSRCWSVCRTVREALDVIRLILQTTEKETKNEIVHDFVYELSPI